MMAEGAGNREWRSLFHVPDGHYFLSHSVGCQPIGVERELANGYMKQWAERGGEAWPDWLATAEAFRGGLADLLGGGSRSYCPQSNLSSGLVKLLGALDLPEDRRTIVMSRDAFPTMGHVVLGLAPMGFRLQLIDDGTSADSLSVWSDAMGPDVAVAVITHVHSNTGRLSDVSALTAICRKADVFSIVDIAQSAGVVPIHLPDWQCDAALGSCVKWLSGGPGAGYLYVRPDKIQALRPTDVGWFSHADPFEFKIDHFMYAEDALRFWGGTPSILPLATALPGLRLIKKIGVTEVLAHNRRLWTRLAETSPYEIPLHTENMGGTLCLPVDPERIAAAKASLADRECKADCRGNNIRLSFHLWNDEADLDALCDALASI